MDKYALDIKDNLDQDSTYRSELFCRGYLISNKKIDYLDGYPFYGLWKQFQVSGYTILAHPEVSIYVCREGKQAAVLIGHAYDPFEGEFREEVILKRILEVSRVSEMARIDYINNLTGVFVLFVFSEQSLWAIQDCGGQKMLYFGKVEGYTVLTSIPQLAADVFNLQWDKDILRLLGTKGYYRGSGFLPGSLSPYQELKRLGANTCLYLDEKGFSISRVYPLKARIEFSTEKQKADAVEWMYHLFVSNLDLIIKKWPRVGLSLTGGVDSRTTVACAKPYYGKFFCYSFESKPSEKTDADAAAGLCQELGIEHHRYIIPDNPEVIQDYELLHKILEHNTSHTCKLHSNEIRKYIWLRRKDDFDVEIKSDMSEVGRAYSDRKYYNVTLPRVLSPRHLTIMQGRYFLEPWAVRFSDMAYDKYMKETGLIQDINGYSMHDLTYWEVRMSAWAATSLSSQEYFHEITIPYNNRRLLDCFLLFPENERKKDEPHKRMMQLGNPVVVQHGHEIKDSYFGKKRMLLETAYYYYATWGNSIGCKKHG